MTYLIKTLLLVLIFPLAAQYKLSDSDISFIKKNYSKGLPKRIGKDERFWDIAALAVIEKKDREILDIVLKTRPMAPEQFQLYQVFLMDLYKKDAQMVIEQSYAMTKNHNCLLLKILPKGGQNKYKSLSKKVGKKRNIKIVREFFKQAAVYHSITTSQSAKRKKISMVGCFSH